jgi:hypothetical protein
MKVLKQDSGWKWQDRAFVIVPSTSGAKSSGYI